MKKCIKMYEKAIDLPKGICYTESDAEAASERKIMYVCCKT